MNLEGAIFLLQEDESLVELREQAYDSEALLQSLLANYPSLLAGDQVNRSDPRRWLLVRREAGVPAKADGGNQWAIDNLFLDQEGIPTIVEVKRSSDTRIRREVVGQMLDYAANAVAYWPAGRIRSMFEERCLAQHEDPSQVLGQFIGAADESGEIDGLMKKFILGLVLAGSLAIPFAGIAFADSPGHGGFEPDNPACVGANTSVNAQLQLHPDADGHGNAAYAALLGISVQDLQKVVQAYCRS
jgi:hypothetical protein